MAEIQPAPAVPEPKVYECDPEMYARWLFLEAESLQIIMLGQFGDHLVNPTIHKSIRRWSRSFFLAWRGLRLAWLMSDHGRLEFIAQRENK